MPSGDVSLAARRRSTKFRRSMLERFDEVILEIAGAVGLRPEADPAGHRRAQHRIVGGDQVRVGRAFPARRRLGADTASVLEEFGIAC